MPVWLKEKLFIKQIIRKRLKETSKDCKVSKIDVVFPGHHLSHITSAFYFPFAKSVFLTVDGVGEWATTSYGTACGEKGIKVLGEVQFPDSIGSVLFFVYLFPGF